MRLSRRLRVTTVALIAVAAAGTGAWLHLRRTLHEALDAPAPATRAIRFVALAAPTRTLARWGGGEIEAVALSETGLITAGGSGIDDGSGRLHDGLPTLAASALTLWRGRPVVALRSGGVFRRIEGRWEEARSGFGLLHARCLEETPAGELLVGAREGLYRVGWGASAIERLDGHPVRALAIDRTLVLAGGEAGLYRVEAGRVTRIDTPDPWIESVAILDGEVFAATAAGLVRGPIGASLERAGGGEDVVAGVGHEGRFYALTDAPAAVRRFEKEGRSFEERVPGNPRRLMTAGGVLFVDTDAGLFRRQPGGFVPVRERAAALPPGSAHVTALAWLGDRLVAGFFDAGLATADARGGALSWTPVEGSSAWGVNALLSAGGVMYVASLRGAARFDGSRLTPLEGPGAAFSLAATTDGIVIGYAQGVLLPGSRLLSAFHGLPGNQAMALAAGPELLVGMPSGLAGVANRRVAWRVAAGEGKLPHPWVTALLQTGSGLYVGTNGGGVVRRMNDGRYEPYVETEGLKVSPGCLTQAGGRVYAGSDGRGLWRLSADGGRFERLSADLPSPRVTALLASKDALFVGTDEGLARMPLAERPELGGAPGAAP
jgi:hypothetical protein